MIITVASFKGGVGKTTTAIHLAGYFQGIGECLLIDGDLNRSATQWASSGQLPYTVADELKAPKLLMSGKFTHTIIDTPARPSEDELQSLSDGCDLLVVPCSPEALAIGALLGMVPVLKALKAEYKVLLTICPPKPSKVAGEAREALENAGLPLFKGEIRRLAAFPLASAKGVLVGASGDRMAGIAASQYEQVGREIYG